MCKWIFFFFFLDPEMLIVCKEEFAALSLAWKRSAKTEERPLSEPRGQMGDLPGAERPSGGNTTPRKVPPIPTLSGSLMASACDLLLLAEPIDLLHFLCP